MARPEGTGGYVGGGCDFSLPGSGSGVPEWEEGNHFWNRAKQEHRFERQFEAHCGSQRKSVGDTRRGFCPHEQ
jgi:hypothetical protein